MVYLHLQRISFLEIKSHSIWLGLSPAVILSNWSRNVPYQGIAEGREVDEEFGTAITQSLYGDGRGGKVIELDKESRGLAEGHEGFEF